MQQPLSLSDHVERFIDRQVVGGDYDSAADIVRAGLRLLEEREIQRQTLRLALAEGEMTGPQLSTPGRGAIVVLPQ